LNLEVLLSSRVDLGINYFPVFRLSLEPHGVLLTARSPIFAEALKKVPKQTAPRIDSIWREVGIDITAFPKLPILRPQDGLFMINPAGPDFIGNRPNNNNNNNLPNLVWLAHPRLDTGIELLFQIPVGFNDLQHYFTSTCTILQDYYCNNIRTIEFQATLQELLSAKADSA
jgi:hypothetical protein